MILPEKGEAGGGDKVRPIALHNYNSAETDITILYQPFGIQRIKRVS